MYKKNKKTTQVQISTKMTIQGSPSADLQSSISRQRSPLWSPALQILATVASPNSQLCLLNSGNLGVLFAFPVPALRLANWLQAVNRGNYRVHLVCFSSLRDLCPVLPIVQCLQTIVLYILSGSLVV